MLKDIFYNAKVITTKEDEARDRVLTRAEETRLLACCQGEREVPYERVRKGKKESVTMKINADNPLLRAIIVLALDSGLRRGEILKLKWKDIDLANGVIYVDGKITKTGESRIAPLSDRAKEELERVRIYSDGVRPFPVTWIGRSFKTAVRIAKLGDVRFHDLRRTFITRQAMAGDNALLVGKISGHAQLDTTLKHYTSIGVEEIQTVNARINADNLAAGVIDSTNSVN